MIDAFLHERVINKSTYQEQPDLLNELAALTELEIYETKIEELDLEAALNFATNALGNAAAFWNTVLRRPKTAVPENTVSKWTGIRR